MKKLVSLMLILGILASTFVVFAYTPVKVIIDDKEVVFAEGDVCAQIINNSTMMPMREIFESLGAKLNWVAETKTVIATTENGKVITLVVGSKNMSVADVASGEVKEIEIPVAPVLVTAQNKAKFGARVLVPMRAISESLDMQVDWDKENYIAYANNK